MLALTPNKQHPVTAAKQKREHTSQKQKHMTARRIHIHVFVLGRVRCSNATRNMDMQQNRAVSIRSCSAYSVKLVTREQRVLFRIPYNMAGTLLFQTPATTKNIYQATHPPPTH